ncbi:unnamed protein product [Durusdinium trenchii]|uniref:Uncharacterized protein n=1 Tax=Durusdinium trenchii TaxID=1381693 RepID=A0ABP0HTF9_9DINO
MREDVLRRALLDPEGEARRRRVQARRRQGRLRWNFTGRTLKARNDRFREHEVDLECRRKLAYRSRGQFRGRNEDQGDQQSAKQRQSQAMKPIAEVAGRTMQEKCQQNKAQKRRRKEVKRPGRQLSPIRFPELPILIADHEDHDMFPALCGARKAAPLVVRTQRDCRKARAQELEVACETFTQELQIVQKERDEAARELRRCCVAEAEAVEELQKALTAAFGTVID